MAITRRTSLTISVGLVAALLVGGAAYYAANSSKTAGGKLRVVASFYPYYYFATRIGGDAADVTNLLPPGVEPHEWEPTPSAIQAIHDADAFVYNGYVEVFLAPLFAELPAGRPARVNASEGIAVRTTDNGQVDPHTWLDPVLAEESAGDLARAFELLRPASAATFQANLQALDADLKGLNGQYSAGLALCGVGNRTIVTQHEAFGYLAKRYNLTQVAIQGLSPDAEPTPEKLREIVSIVTRTGVKYIFYESLVNPDVAKTLANQAHVGTMILDPIEGLTPEGQAAGKDYLSIMGHDNLDALRQALGCS